MPQMAPHSLDNGSQVVSQVHRTYKSRLTFAGRYCRMGANHKATALGVQGRGRCRADTEGASRRDRLIVATKLSGHRTLYLGTLENPRARPRVGEPWQVLDQLRQLLGQRIGYRRGNPSGHAGGISQVVDRGRTAIQVCASFLWQIGPWFLWWRNDRLGESERST
jgi:hypothetical protein